MAGPRLPLALIAGFAAMLGGAIGFVASGGESAREAGAAPALTIAILRDAPPAPAQAEPPPPAPAHDRLRAEGRQAEDAAPPSPPRIAADGRAPWRAHARPFPADERRPLVAILVTGLGLSAEASESAIAGLPGAVTLAFLPYADDLDRWLRRARDAGHEVLLNLPMEPVDWPPSDPGPQALLTSLSEADNLARLDWVLGRGTGYVGVVALMGSHFATVAERLAPVLRVLGERGLMFVDSRASPHSKSESIARELGLPWAGSVRRLDDEASRAAIDTRLAELEAVARERGHALAIGHPYPVTLARLRAWAATLEGKGLALAPASALAAARRETGG